MDIKIKFSFLKLFNSIKGVGKAAPEGSCDTNWLKSKANKATQERYKKFFEWCKAEGITHPKVQYPVMFGEGDSAYPGMLALDDIGPNEPFVKVPSRLIISTAKAFESPELREIFYENPDVFGKHVSLGEDNVLDAYILYHLNLGAKSPHYQMMQCWPTPSETDILMNWDDESLEWLQDPTLAEDASRGYEEFTLQWNNLYKCLRKYPDMFPESSIGLNKFKWVYILTTNRCFGSNWPGVCQMVPFADYVNHENVDTGFDCVDKDGVSLEIKRERDEETARDKLRKRQAETRNSIFNMKTDLLDIEMQLRKKILDKGLQTQTQAQIDDQAMNLKLMHQVQAACQNAENNQVEKPVEAEPDEKGYVSSGLSSDDDVDLMLEQEVMRDKKKYGVAVNLPPAETGSTAGVQGSQEIVLGKDESMRIWELTLENVPKEYEFQIRTYNDVYPKGSQVYICYGRMSNREMLKRYGFCLPNNKYNNMFIKLRLDVTDPDFKYRYYILQKFFNMEIDDGNQQGSLNVQSRHFKIYYQKFNRKILKFVKILSFNVKEDDIATVIETRSLSLEYISLQKLRNIYEDFLNSFPTSLKEDLAMMRDPQKSKHFTVRHYMGMVYRTEQKRILINQIKLVRVAMHILERIMRGSTLEFAVLRVHELESKQDHPVNRIMLANYLAGLQRGMQANAELYYKQRGLKQDEGEELLREVQREMRFEVSKQAYKQFEVRGYEKMMERIMEAPMASAMLENHSQLQDTLLSIQEAMAKQKDQIEILSRQVEAKIRARQALKAIEDAQVHQESVLSILPNAPIENSGASGQDQQAEGSDVSYYDSEYESETDDGPEESKENTSVNVGKIESMKMEWDKLKSLAKQEQASAKPAEIGISASTNSSKDVYFD